MNHVSIFLIILELFLVRYAEINVDYELLGYDEYESS